jgi:hypothetical protein
MYIIPVPFVETLIYSRSATPSRALAIYKTRGTGTTIMSGMPAPPALPRRRAGGMRRQAGDTGVIKTNDDAQATKL